MTPFGHDLRERDPSDYHFPGSVLHADREALWFDHVRLGTEFPYGKAGKFNYYSIGGDGWHTAGSPYENRPDETFFFSADRKLTRPGTGAGELSFTYDPDRPFHRDRHDYMFRCEFDTCNDGLTFLSEPFESDRRYFGPVEFRLTVSSDCTDTAFFCRLYLVENGNAYNISDAATTLLHCDPGYRKGQKTRLSILSQPTAFAVKRGSRIRVDVSSFSDCFVPHANTSVHFALAERTRVAHNTVFAGESSVLLPSAESRIS
jgi:predicted acyl esterase